MRSIFGASTPKATKTEELRLFRLEEGSEIEVLVRRHKRATRIKLSIDGAKGLPVLTLPSYVPEREGEAFLVQNQIWLRNALANLPDRIPLSHGSVIPLRGVDVTIDLRPNARGVTRVEDGLLIVTGDEAHTARRATDFLKRQARAEIVSLARDKAQRLDRKPGRISIRDTRTRWGSCSAKGDLSFSWRLILTPPEILSYVVCHEVAHLVHMDHSSAFWRTVARIDPDYEAHRRWLHANGNTLHSIG